MKYSPEIVKEICDYIQGGSSNIDSATMSGISEDTFYEWKKEHSEFSESLKKAEAIRKARLVALILTASESSWQAGAWYLERVYPSEYGRRETLKHEGNLVTGVTVEFIDKIEDVDKAEDETEDTGN